MVYTDMHTHLLCGVDDGAKDEETMRAMLDAAYADGVRRLCATPHFQPDFYGDNTRLRDEAFARLSAYAAERYPDLSLSLGNEIGYRTECLDDIRKGNSLLLGGKYVLLDFPADVSLFIMENALSRFFSGGYRVVLAHVERYEALFGEYKLLREWQESGVYFQMTASYLAASLSGYARKHRKKLLSTSLISMVASDGHDLSFRPMQLSAAEKALCRFGGQALASQLLYHVPNKVLNGEDI